MKQFIIKIMEKLMLLQFEQRRILANFCSGLALVCTAQLIFVRPGFFNVIMAVMAIILLLRFAVVLTKQEDKDV